MDFKDVIDKRRAVNFFDTENPKLITLKPTNDNPESIQVITLAQEPGYYEVVFQLSYHVGGKDKIYKSETIKLYYGGT